MRTNGYIVKENNINHPIGEFLLDEKEKDEKKLFDYLLLGKTFNWAGVI